MKKGLILEGGAMRGMFTAGVMDVLMEAGIVFDGAVGVSAGAAFGCNYKSGQIGRVLRYNTRFVRDKRYCGWRVLLRTGDMFSADFCFGEVPRYLDPFDFDAYGKNPMEFYLVCTDMETGEAVYHKYEGWEDAGFDWIRASASMPLVSRPVEIGGRKLLDGGIADSIPVKFFEGLGYDRNLLVLTRPREYRKRPNRAMLWAKWKYRKYPNFIRTMERRHEMYNQTLAYIEQGEAEGRHLVIRPSEPLPLRRVERDPEKLREVYELGREATRERLGEISRFLGGS